MHHCNIDGVYQFTERVFNVAALDFAAPSVWLSQRDEEFETLFMVILDAELGI